MHTKDEGGFIFVFIDGGEEDSRRGTQQVLHPKKELTLQHTHTHHPPVSVRTHHSPSPSLTLTFDLSLILTQGLESRSSPLSVRQVLGSAHTGNLGSAAGQLQGRARARSCGGGEPVGHLRVVIYHRLSPAQREIPIFKNASLLQRAAAAALGSACCKLRLSKSHDQPEMEDFQGCPGSGAQQPASTNQVLWMSIVGGGQVVVVLRGGCLNAPYNPAPTATSTVSLASGSKLCFKDQSQTRVQLCHTLTNRVPGWERNCHLMALTESVEPRGGAQA